MIKLKENHCDFCGSCVSVCPTDAIELFESQLLIVEDKCIDCKNCVAICPIKALEWYDERKV